jgi:predicted amidohydrolase YtcJ
MGSRGPTADPIFTGGDIITIDRDRPEVEAVAVIGERIFALGDRADVMRYDGPSTEIVDLDGATLMPGFVEAHGHPLMTAMSWGDPVVDIRAIHTPTYDAAMAKLRPRVAKAKPGEYLWFLGLDPMLHEGMHEPTKAELDEIALDNPLCIQTASYHVAYANTAAVRAVWDAEKAISMKGGQIVNDDNGEPWRLQEAAMMAFSNAFSDQWGDERAGREFNNWIWHFSHAGFTTTSEMGAAPDWPVRYDAAIRRSGLPTRLFGYEFVGMDGAP